MVRKVEKEERNEHILLDIVEDYIKTARPVSSGELLYKHKYHCSPATIRNIMSELGEAGFLSQPHTSAGRIPTEKAYRFFVDKVALGSRKPIKRSKRDDEILHDIQQEFRGAVGHSSEEAAHMLSHHLAEMTSAMAFVGLLNINRFYKEGLSYLLDEPEFFNPSNIRNLIAYAESLEKRLESMSSTLHDEIRIYIGSEQKELPSSSLSVMALTSELPNHEKAIFGILGPVRMPYGKHLSLLESVRDLFNTF